MESAFVSEGLERKLNAMDQSARAAFATSCAQRLFGAYQVFCNVGGADPSGLHDVLDALWDHLLGHRNLSSAELGAMCVRCESFVPGDLLREAVLADQAEDAAAAAAFASSAFSSVTTAEAVWAARRGYDAVSSLVMRRLYDRGEPCGGVETDRAVVVQRELSRQERDCEMLRGKSRVEPSWVATIMQLRRMAVSDSADWGREASNS